MHDIKELLNNIKIRPNSLDLYLLALTHPSYNADVNTKHQDYERLEYMGDAVLGFAAADLIFKAYPEMDQGLMSKLRSNLVKSSSLADYARSINLANYIKTGHSINPDKINESNKILEDVFESLIGAIYLDKGLNVAFKFISHFLKKDIKNIQIEDLTDSKTRLQEEMQAEHRDSVHYELVNQSGPAHDRTFVVNVLFNDIVLGTGSGKSKKMAEEAAAKDALSKRSI